MKLVENFGYLGDILEWRGVMDYKPFEFETTLDYGLSWLRNSFDLQSCFVLDFAEKYGKNHLICVDSDEVIILYKEFENYASIKEYSINNLPKKYKKRTLQLLKELELI